MLRKLIVTLISLFITVLVCSCDQKTNATQTENTEALSEEKMPTSKEIMEQFIKTFPELKPSDFPALDSEENAFRWLMTWQSDYEIAEKYIARSDYKDWDSRIEESINELKVVEGKSVILAPTLNKMYAKIEKLEDDEDHSLDIDETYTAYYENVVDEVLKQKFDVIGSDNGEGADFILAKPNNPELPKLAKMLQIVYPESQISVYQTQDYPNKYHFEFIEDKLGR